jgi:hypothetical protein
MENPAVPLRLGTSLLVPFDDNFTEGCPLLPRDVLGKVGGPPQVFDTDAFGFNAASQALHAIDPERCVSYSLSDKRSWSELMRWETSKKDINDYHEQDPLYLPAVVLLRCLVVVYLTEDGVVTRHPNSDKYNVAVADSIDGAVPLITSGRLVIRATPNEETIGEVFSMRQRRPVPGDECKGKQLKKAGTGPGGKEREQDKTEGLPKVEQTKPGEEKKPVEDKPDACFEEARKMSKAVQGNLVDNNLDMMYTDDSMAMLKKGGSHFLAARGRAEVIAGQYGAIFSEHSWLNLGAEATVDTPIDQIAFGPENVSINPLAYYLPVGTIVTPYPMFTMKLPSDILMAVATVKDIMS